VQAVEAFALAGAWSLGALALLHAIVWRAERQRWSLLFAAGYALVALVYVFDARLQAVAQQPNPIAVAMTAPAVVFITLGMIDYAGPAAPIAARLRALAVAVGTLTLALVLLKLMPRIVGFTVYSGFMLGQAVLALAALRREPRRGPALVFSALMLYPAVVGAAWLGLIDVQWLRYAVILPTAVSGATVLTTGLLRAQQRAAEELQRRERAEAALQALNESLEQRVAQRTGELREMVECLEGFNRSVSHDLRGPLGGIAGVSRLAAEALERGDEATVRRLLPVINGQAEASAQLVGDLLGNAIKFSRESAPPQVEAGAFAENGEQVLFVRDNGAGFDPGEAERHGGRLWAQGTPNGGATFHFSLGGSASR